MANASRRVVAIIQARTSSVRLPGKVLRDIGGEPMLMRVVSRVRRAANLDDVVVATSKRPDDDAVADLANSRGVMCVRGELEDVVDRFRVAAEAMGADVIVRITADCPLIDSSVIARVIAAFLEGDADYASNVWPTRTFPRGLDTEVFSRGALERSARDAKEPSHREHVTQYILRGPVAFRTLNVVHAVDYSAHRWTVDTEQDLELVRRIYSELPTPCGGLEDVLAVLARHPEWLELNRRVEQKLV
ncbi:MAG: glycosyltransferase family protein [Labilithrix sp.]|nr:glycosyltransferase family protein [Labilithrix sp.]